MEVWANAALPTAQEFLLIFRCSREYTKAPHGEEEQKNNSNRAGQTQSRGFHLENPRKPKEEE